MQSFTSIPFKIEGMHGGFSQVEGIGKFSSAGIVLEFEAKIFGIMKTGVKEVRIPLAEILDVKFKKGFLKFGAKIEIRLKSFAKLNELPSKDGKVRLQIHRDDHSMAERSVKEIQNNLEDYSRNLPPQQVSVKELFDDETKELS